MKVSSVNVHSLVFKSNDNKGVQNNNDYLNRKEESNSKKVLLYSLTGLAVIGLGAVLINNVKKGKVKPAIDPQNPVQPPSGDAAASSAISGLTDEAKNILENVRRRLDPSYGPKINDEFIDKHILNENNAELKYLNRWYRSLEKKSDKIIANGEVLKAQISEIFARSRSIDPELGAKIDADFASRVMDPKERASMTDFYTKMAEDAEEKAKLLAAKQAKKEAMLKLKAENPQEYARLKKERINAEKETKRAQKAEIISKNTKEIELSDGTKGIEVTIPTKAGILRRVTTEDGTLIREIRQDGLISVHSIYNKDSKFVYIVDKDRDVHVSKVYDKRSNGEYALISREVVDLEKKLTKTVERLSDGNTKITKENAYSKKVIIMDKKGNIIFQDEIGSSGAPKPPEVKVLVLADWYMNYQKLCKKYDVTPRACGPGGAWDHYYELCLKENDAEAYASYLRRRAHQAGYNEKAKLAEFLDKLEAGNLDVKNLTEDDIEFLKYYVSINSENSNSALNIKIAKLIEDFQAYQKELARKTQQTL